MAWTKKFKKATGKVSTAAKKRYGIGKGRGGFKFSQVAKDLEMIKSRLNVEKKFIDTDLVNDFTIGQSDGNSAGYAISPISLGCSQGVGENNRVGNSIKVTGMVVRMNFRGQMNCGKRIAKICVVRSLNEDLTGSALADLFDANPLTGFPDFHSPRNYASMRGKTASHKIIATKYCKIESANSEDPVGTIKLPIKLSDVVRYASDGDTTPEDFRYHLLMFLDYGNKSIGTTTTNLGCVIPTVSSGVIANTQTRVWYVDN